MAAPTPGTSPGPRGKLVDVDGRRLRLTNLDKVMYPDTGTTKGEVIDYYSRVAPAMLPHLRGRPVTRIRWPDGTGGERFFAKDPFVADFLGWQFFLSDEPRHRLLGNAD